MDLAALARAMDDFPQVKEKSAPLCKFAISCVFCWLKARYKEACVISGFAVVHILRPGPKMSTCQQHILMIRSGMMRFYP